VIVEGGNAPVSAHSPCNLFLALAEIILRSTFSSSDWSEMCRRFDIQAFSGGGGGSLQARRDEFTAASFDPDKRVLSDRKGERGGPLPPG
jgi:hypothetical protein